MQPRGRRHEYLNLLVVCTHLISFKDAYVLFKSIRDAFYSSLCPAEKGIIAAVTQVTQNVGAKLFLLMSSSVPTYNFVRTDIKPFVGYVAPKNVVPQLKQPEELISQNVCVR